MNVNSQDTNAESTPLYNSIDYCKCSKFHGALGDKDGNKICLICKRAICIGDIKEVNKMDVIIWIIAIISILYFFICLSY